MKMAPSAVAATPITGMAHLRRYVRTLKKVKAAFAKVQVIELENAA